MLQRLEEPQRKSNPAKGSADSISFKVPKHSRSENSGLNRKLVADRGLLFTNLALAAICGWPQSLREIPCCIDQGNMAQGLGKVTD